MEGGILEEEERVLVGVVRRLGEEAAGVKG